MKFIKKLLCFSLFMVVGVALCTPDDDVMKAVQALGTSSTLTADQQATCKILMKIIQCKPSNYTARTVSAVSLRCGIKINTGDLGPTGSMTPYQREDCVSTGGK
jgi:hypothetical protein